MYIFGKEVYMDQKTDLIGLLPPDISASKDLAALRNLRDHVDGLVQNVKHEREQASIEKYKAIYVGKYMLSYARVPYLSSAIKEENQLDITIRKIISIQFVGRGFIRCKTQALHIQYDKEQYGPSMGANLINKGYGSVTLEYIEDENDDISLDKVHQFVDKETINSILADFEKYKQEIRNSFTDKLEKESENGSSND